jgi:hypothetical protein
MRASFAFVTTIGLSLFCLTMTGCPGNAPGGTGTVKLMITDKPFPVDLLASAEVTITSVELRAAETEAPSTQPAAKGVQAAGAENQTVDSDEAAAKDDGATFITIFEGERTFDLLDLRGGRADLLADAEVPAGQYDQARLIVTAGRVVLTDGREFNLTVPSGAQSGIKLNFTFEVQQDQETPLLLDVDLSRAFTPIPGGHIEDPATIQEFKFQPSIAMRLINLLEAGAISGLVSDLDGNPLGDVLVTAYDDQTEVTSTVSKADGTYQLTGLYAAVYRVEYSATGYVDAEMLDVPVTAGQDAPEVNIALSPAND